jgi:hypothetical protein
MLVYLYLISTKFSNQFGSALRGIGVASIIKVRNGLVLLVVRRATSVQNARPSFRMSNMW